MNKDTFQGKWHEIKGKLKTQWGKLTDDDLAQINGKREELLGRIQKRYGYEKDRAEHELQSFENSCGCCHTENEKTFDDELAKPAKGHKH